MNLISCDGCGVVLDKDKLSFQRADELFDEDGVVNENIAGWSSASDDYVPKVQCPVCQADILNEIF
jgi:hypothetical protein